MKRFVKKALGCIVLWYGALLFLLPSFSCGPTPGLTLAAHSSLKNHFVAAKMGRESFGDIKSLTLDRFLSIAPRGNRYYIVVVAEPSDEPIWTLAYPQYASTYQRDLIVRVAFLAGARFSFPTYLLREDGLFCSMRMGIDLENPPSKKLLVNEGKPPASASCYDLNVLAPESES